MPFIVPTFNLLCNVWSNDDWRANWPSWPAIATYFDVPCQLRGHLKQTTPWTELVIAGSLLELCLPALTDVRDVFYFTQEYPSWTWVIEVPSGSGCFYFVVGISDQAKGFPNEYRSVILAPTRSYESPFFGTLPLDFPRWPYAPVWPTPYP